MVAIGGEVSNFQQEESLIYTATFNSVVAASDSRSIHIPTHVFTDAHGESNHESNLFQWNYDNSRPTITITAEDRYLAHPSPREVGPATLMIPSLMDTSWLLVPTNT